MSQSRRQPRTPGPDEVVVPPGSPDWITADLIRLTLKVWQKRYAETLSVQDAVTILLAVGRLFGVLSREAPP